MAKIRTETGAVIEVAPFFGIWIPEKEAWHFEKGVICLSNSRATLGEYASTISLPPDAVIREWTDYADYVGP